MGTVKAAKQSEQNCPKECDEKYFGNLDRKYCRSLRQTTLASEFCQVWSPTIYNVNDPTIICSWHYTYNDANASWQTKMFNAEIADDNSALLRTSICD